MQSTDTPTLTLPDQTPFNQQQIQAQAIQAQREQFQRAVIQQAFANKLAVSTAVFQGLTMLSASVLMIAIASYAFTH